MAVTSKILQVLNELFSGTGREREKMELFTLLRDMADALARGEVTMEEIEPDLRKLAGAVAAFRNAAGLESNVEDIYNKLVDAIATDMSIKAVDVLRVKYAGLRARGRKRKEEGLGLI